CCWWPGPAALPRSRCSGCCRATSRPSPRKASIGCCRCRKTRREGRLFSACPPVVPVQMTACAGPPATGRRPPRVPARSLRRTGIASAFCARGGYPEKAAVRPDFPACDYGVLSGRLVPTCPPTGPAGGPATADWATSCDGGHITSVFFLVSIGSFVLARCKRLPTGLDVVRALHPRLVDGEGAAQRVVGLPTHGRGFDLVGVAIGSADEVERVVIRQLPGAGQLGEVVHVVGHLQ